MNKEDAVRAQLAELETAVEQLAQKVHTWKEEARLAETLHRRVREQEAEIARLNARMREASTVIEEVLQEMNQWQPKEP